MEVAEEEDSPEVEATPEENGGNGGAGGGEEEEEVTAAAAAVPGGSAVDSLHAGQPGSAMVLENGGNGGQAGDFGGGGEEDQVLIMVELVEWDFHLEAGRLIMAAVEAAVESQLIKSHLEVMQDLAAAAAVAALSTALAAAIVAAVADSAEVEAEMTFLGELEDLAEEEALFQGYQVNLGAVGVPLVVAVVELVLAEPFSSKTILLQVLPLSPLEIIVSSAVTPPHPELVVAPVVEVAPLGVMTFS